MKKLKKALEKSRGIKWFLCSKSLMVKSTPEGEDQTSTPHFRSTCITTTDPHTIQQQYEEAATKIKSSFLEYQREGSGWQLEEVRQSFL